MALFHDIQDIEIHQMNAPFPHCPSNGIGVMIEWRFTISQ